MISKIIAEDLIAKVKKAIDGADKIVIVAHVGPDGDAMGSTLALWHYLMTIEKKPVVIVPTAFPTFFNWMPGAEQVLIYEDSKEKADELFVDADLIFTLDFNTPSRMAKMADAVIEANQGVQLTDVVENQTTEEVTEEFAL